MHFGNFYLNWQCWVWMVLPGIMGLVGLLLAFNVFGSADEEARFYRGRADWYPVLQGDERGTHRMTGGIMLVCAIITALAFSRIC